MVIKVLICDDQDVVREGLQAILKTCADIEVVGLSSDGLEALELIPLVHPDIVLMDLKMPSMNGIQATHQITIHHPGVRVLVLTTYDADQWVFDAIRSGAAGYLLKDTPRQQLVEAIKGTIAGKTHIDPAVAGKLFAQVQNTSQVDTSVTAALSERELEILSLLARGLSNADIAARLYLSEGTVRNYVSAIFNKLGVNDRTQAAVLALRYGVAKMGDI
jgi:DNA-binding NarL/FixJ family response regulator